MLVVSIVGIVTWTASMFIMFTSIIVMLMTLVMLLMLILCMAIRGSRDALCPSLMALRIPHMAGRDACAPACHVALHGAIATLSAACRFGGCWQCTGQQLACSGPEGRSFRCVYILTDI